MLLAIATTGIAPQAALEPLATYRLGAGWATFGLALPLGAARDGLRVGTLETQTDVKTTWPDGSIRFAVVTARVPAAGDRRIEPGPASGPAHRTVPPPSATVVLAMGGETWTASQPSSSSDPWLAGPLVTEARTLVAPVSGGHPHPFLRVMFDVRTYVSGERRIDVAVQNVLDVAEANEVTYDVRVEVDGTPVFAQAGLTHPYATRWRRVFRAGGLVESDVVPDSGPFRSAGAVPAFAATIADSTSGAVTGPAFGPLGHGLIIVPLDEPGVRPEQAPYPDWAARYLRHHRAEERAVLIAHGDLAGSWSVHVTEPDGVRLISIDEHPDYWFDWRAGPDGPRNHLRGIRPFGESAYQPSLAFVPYLLTGDRYYLDEIRFWANYGLLATYQDPITNARQGRRGLLAANDVRGIAWSLRTLEDVAAYVPDADPYRAYFRDKVRNNLAWLEAYGATAPGGPFEWLFAGKRPEDLSYAPASVVAPWEQQMLLWAIDRAIEHGLGPGAATRDRIAASTVRLFSSQPALTAVQAASPLLVVGTQTPSRFQPTFHPGAADIAQATQAVFGSTAVTVQSVLSARLALAIARASGVAGAAGALDALDRLVVDGQSVDAATTVHAGWALTAEGMTSGAVMPPRNVRVQHDSESEQTDEQLHPPGTLPPDIRPMRLTVPRTSQAPVLDGRIDLSEWRNAVALTGLVQQFDGVAHPRQAVFWVTYDDTRLYVAQRSTLRPGELADGPRQMPQWFVDNDNVAFIAVAPPVPPAGQPPGHYQFRASVTGKQWQQQVRWEAQGFRIRYPQNIWWQSGWSFANGLSADQTVWESEYAIPLSDITGATNLDDAEWGLLVARDYPSNDQSANVVSNDWRFGPANRFWGTNVYDNYRLENRYAGAVFARGVPAVQVLSLGNLAAGQLAPDVGVTNTGAAPTSVTGIVTVTSGALVLHTEQRTATVAPGTRSPLPFSARTFKPGRPYRLTLEVRDAGGAVLIRQDVPFKADYAATRAPAVPDVFFSGAHKEGDFLGALMSAYNPIRNTLTGKVYIYRLPGRERAVRADITVRRQGDAQPFFTMPLPPFDNDGIAEAQQALPPVRPGVHEIVARVWAADGALLARASDLFIRYDHQKDLPWLENTLGVTDQVLPPFTPIEVNAGITELRTWGRRYRVDGSGLPTSLVSGGEDLLAGPVRIEVSGTATSALVPVPSLLAAEAAPNRARYRGQLDGAGLTVGTEGSLDYDGYLRLALRLDPAAGQSISAVRLVVPLRPEQATHLQSVGNNLLASMTAMALSGGAGTLWHSGQQRDPNYRNGLRVGTFKPYVWIGNASRGLAFMADNDRGWVPDDTNRVPAIEVRRTATSVDLVLNLVARPFAFDGPRDIVFSLQATPVRPLPDDFRHRITRIRNTLTFPGADADGLAEDGTYGLGYRDAGPAFPLSWAKNKAFREKAERDGLVYAPYQATNSWISVLEVDDPRAPGLQGANLYGYIAPEVTATWTWGDAVMTKTDADYRLYRYDRWIQESGLGGFYFDSAYPSLGTNVAAGHAYVLDLPDRADLNGRVQPGYALTGLREFFKRLRTILVGRGHDPWIVVHATHSPMISAYAFADFMIEGEEARMRPDLVFSEAWRPEELQTSNPSQKWGIGSLFLASSSQEGRFQGAAHFENMIGYLMLHDADVWENHYFWPGYVRNGLDLTRRADFLPYWDATVASALRTPGADVLASAWRQGQTLFVLAFNRSWNEVHGGRRGAAAAALGVSGTVAEVSDIGTVGTNPPISAVPAGSTVAVTLDIGAHQWRVLRIDLR